MPTKTQRWIDGRSGESGQVAGNLVLDHVDASGSRMVHLRGTIFVDARNCWIGRVVADDSYLSNGVAHWANISADQQRQMLREAAENKRKLFYLFITAHAKSNLIRYWQVPAEVLGRELVRRNKNGKGDVLGLHISIRGQNYFLGEEDVTDCVGEFNVGTDDSIALNSAVEIDRSRKASSPVTRDNVEASQPATTIRRFDIPISDGRLVTFHAPVPMSKGDVDRIKNYIDIVTDLLV